MAVLFVVTDDLFYNNNVQILGHLYVFLIGVPYLTLHDIISDYWTCRNSQREFPGISLKWHLSYFPRSFHVEDSQSSTLSFVVSHVSANYRLQRKRYWRWYMYIS